MVRPGWRALFGLRVNAVHYGRASAQQALTWRQVPERFRDHNPKALAPAPALPCAFHRLNLAAGREVIP